MKKKLFAVVWTEKGREEYGVPDEDIIVNVDTGETVKINTTPGKRGRPIYRYENPLAIFTSNEAAESFRAGNTDWAVACCDTTLSL